MAQLLICCLNNFESQLKKIRNLKDLADGVAFFSVSKLFLIELEVETFELKVHTNEDIYQVIKDIIRNIIGVQEELMGMIDHMIENAINGDEIELAMISIILLSYGLKINCKVIYISLKCLASRIKKPTAFVNLQAKFSRTNISL